MYCAYCGMQKVTINLKQTPKSGEIEPVALVVGGKQGEVPMPNGTSQPK